MAFAEVSSVFLVLWAGRSEADLTIRPEERGILINRYLAGLASHVAGTHLSGERCITVVKEPGLLQEFKVNNTVSVLEVNSTEGDCRELVEDFYRSLAYKDKCTGYVVQLVRPDCGFLGWWDVYKRRYVPRHNPKFFFLPVYPDTTEYASDLFSIHQTDLSQYLLAAEVEENQSDWTVQLSTNNFYVHPTSTNREPKIILDEWHHKTGFRHNKDLYPDKILNLNKKPFRVATGWYPPYVLAVPLDGVENRFAITFCSLHNCSAVAIEDGFGWGIVDDENFTGNGIIYGAYGDASEIGTMGVFLWHGPSFYLDYTASYLYGDVTLLTPRPKRIGGWVVPFLPFGGAMWTAFVVSLALGALSLYFVTTASIKYTRFADILLKKVQFTTLEDSTMRAIGLAVLQTPSSRLIGDTPSRYLFTSFEFLYLVLSAMYSAELASFLTVPLYYPPIDSFHDFAESGVLWMTNHPVWSLYLRGSTDEEAKKVVDHFRVYPDEKLIEFVKEGKYAYAVDRMPGGSVSEQIHITSEVIPLYHIMKGGLFGSPLVSAIKKGGPYNEHYNRVINKVIEHGLSLYWEADVSRMYLNSTIQAEYKEAKSLVIDSNPTVIELSHIIGVIYLYSIGIAASLIVFVGELLRAKHNRYQHNHKSI